MIAPDHDRGAKRPLAHHGLMRRPRRAALRSRAAVRAGNPWKAHALAAAESSVQPAIVREFLDAAASVAAMSCLARERGPAGTDPCRAGTAAEILRHEARIGKRLPRAQTAFAASPADCCRSRTARCHALVIRAGRAPGRPSSAARRARIPPDPSPQRGRLLQGQSGGSNRPAIVRRRLIVATSGITPRSSSCACFSPRCRSAPRRAGAAPPSRRGTRQRIVERMVISSQ